MATSLYTGGDGPVTAIVCTPRLVDNFGSNIAPAANATPTLSGAMTAGVLKTGLSITGRGRFDWGGIYTADATTRTLRVKVTCDGVSILDFTSAAISASGRGYAFIGLGSFVTNDPMIEFQPIQFNQSFLIEIASSLTETDKATLSYNYEVWA